MKQAIERETDPTRREDLQWELKIIETAKAKFDKVEDLYQAHRNSVLPLPLLKLEHELHLRDLMPKCQMEELGGYRALTEEEINGSTHLPNQPLWRLSWIQKHSAAILDYASAPRVIVE